MKPETSSDANWMDPTFEQPWEDILNFGIPDKNDLKFKITVPVTVTKDILNEWNVQIAIHGPNPSSDNGNSTLPPPHPNWVTFNLGDIGKVASSGTIICCNVSNSDVVKKIMPSIGSGTLQYASLDWVKNPEQSSYDDSNNFDAGIGSHVFSKMQLVDARDQGNPTPQPTPGLGGTIEPWVAAANKTYFAGGGAFYVDIRMTSTDSDFTGGARALCRETANWLYYSGHGLHSGQNYEGFPYPGGCLILPTGTNGQPNYILPNAVQWKNGVDCVVIAGCAVLDIDDFNNNYPNQFAPQPTSHHDSPGKLWATTGPKYLLGYNYTAPADKPTGADIANIFGLTNITSDPIDLWRQANANDHSWNACAIGNGYYYYFKKTVLFGVTINAQWTSVPKNQW